MRLLLISGNRHDRFGGSLPFRPMPLGVAFLLGAFRESHHRVHFLDLMFPRAPRPAIRRAIAESSPDLIGIAVRNLDAMGGRPARTFLQDIRSYIRTCRQEAEAPIVLGGPAVSLLPREAFTDLEPDFISAGDATRTFPELVDRLEQGKAWGDLPGLVFRSAGDIRVNPPGPWEAPQVSPCYDSFDLPRYEAAGYGISVLTKTWPFIRTGGAIPMSAMPDPIPRPIPSLLDDLRDLRTRFQIQKVFLADSGFNVPLPDAKTLCRVIRDAGLGLSWATGLQPGHMDDELAGLMREAGCRMVLLTGPGPIQEPISDFDRHLTEFALAAGPVSAAGISLVATVIFGRPGETRDMVERTLAVITKLDPAHVQLSAGIRLLPFTPLAERAKAEGVIRQDGDCLQPVVYLAPGLKDWLPRRLRAAARIHPNWHVV